MGTLKAYNPLVETKNIYDTDYIANNRGVDWWLRSPYKIGFFQSVYVRGMDGIARNEVDNVYALRPAFQLKLGA